MWGSGSLRGAQDLVSVVFAVSVLYFLLLLFCLLHLLDFYSLTVSEFSATAELVLSDMFVVLAHILPYSSS